MEEQINVGNKIKNLRNKLNMTAKQLASNANISVGMLSQLENGSTQGSVETLRKIAKVLNTTLAQLFMEENEQITTTKVSNESLYIVRNNQRKTISFPDPLYHCELLVPDLQGEIEFVLVHLKPNRVTNEILPHTRGGEECNYVLSGEIVITIDTDEYTLREGDCIRFNPEIPHKIENKSNQKASYLSAITPVSF